MASVFFSKWQRRTALIAALGVATSGVAPLMIAAPAAAQSTFYDIRGSWAQACIQSLAQRNIVSGYPDGSFRPTAPVTRAEFAAMVRKAFPDAARSRNPMQFVDVRPGYWAYSAIREAAQTGFLSGYPDQTFRPSQNIPRVQALVSLSSGLDYTPTASTSTILSNTYEDAIAIPDYARSAIAAATQNRLVVSYPNVRYLNPNQLATRAEIASFLCQALTGPQQASLISSEYIAGVSSAPQTIVLEEGTTIPVRYSAERIIIDPNETAPLTLVVDQDITTRGVVVIPAGSQVVGQLQPASRGSRFVASEVIIDGRRYRFDATSSTITEIKDVRDPDVKSILGSAALGAGAAAGISAVVGDVDASEVLTGAGVGVAAGVNRNRPITSTLRDAAIGAAVVTGISAITGGVSVEKSLGGAAAAATVGGLVDRPAERVVIIDPDSDLTLTLTDNFEVR